MKFFHLHPISVFLSLLPHKLLPKLSGYQPCGARIGKALRGASCDLGQVNCSSSREISHVKFLSLQLSTPKYFLPHAPKGPQERCAGGAVEEKIPIPKAPSFGVHRVGTDSSQKSRGGNMAHKLLAVSYSHPVGIVRVWSCCRLWARQSDCSDRGLS